MKLNWQDQRKQKFNSHLYLHQMPYLQFSILSIVPNKPKSEPNVFKRFLSYDFFFNKHGGLFYPKWRHKAVFQNKLFSKLSETC
jgi:hypothetical protein